MTICLLLKRKKIIFLLISVLFCSFNYSLAQLNFRGSAMSVGSDINSPYNEQDPVLSPDGMRIYFTRSKHPQNIGGIKDQGDIWYSEKDTAGNWTPAKNAGTVWNNQENNAIIGFFNDGNAVFLDGHYDPSGAKPVTRGISVSYQSGNHWTFPEPVEIKYFKQNSEHQNASLSADGQVMVFSLESYASRGAEDLYVCFRRHDGTWTDIQNLGPVVNTAYEEMTPYISPDNKTLIFASNGHGGEGSFDLFMTRRLDDTWKNWSEPENLGAKVNSNGRELYYFPDIKNQKIYFCSTLNSEGYGDIKYIMIAPVDSIFEKPVAQTPPEPEPAPDSVISFKPDTNMYVISGKVLSSSTNNPISGKINLFLPNNAPLGTVKTDPETGTYSLEISSDKQFDVKVSAKGYMNVEESLSTHDFTDKHLTRDYYLEPLETGRVFRLNNVLFQQSTAILLDSSYAELNLVYEMMKENPDIDIELSGYTDNLGDPHKNLVLSQERVNVVEKYLINKGIDPSRISGKGYGGMYPIASNAVEATRRLNRRVEFKVIRKDNH